MEIIQILRNNNLFFVRLTIIMFSSLFLVLLVLIFERIINLRKIFVNEKNIYNELNDAVSGKDYFFALETCEKIFSPLTNLIKAGLNHRNYSKIQINKAINQAVQLELPKIEKNLTIISILISFLPFISLIIILINNIETFFLLEAKTANLINFFLYNNKSLFIFIIILSFTILISILYYYVINKKNDIILLFEKWANELVYSLIQKGKK